MSSQPHQNHQNVEPNKTKPHQNQTTQWFATRRVRLTVAFSNGGIKVSRSIVDVYLKKPEFNRDPLFLQFGNPIPLKRPLLTAEPSIVTRNLRPQDLFLIFASDGLWEHLSDKAAVDIVYKYPRDGIAKRLVTAALHEAAKKREQNSVGSISAPVDIFSYNSDEVEENPVDKIFPNEESRHILAVS
ncbi:putative protein phosphatase 2C 63 [Abeliophyllum distichum]|uniref:PPM-type phosphatase domain-containing protein n=1 Tax=Abeliophyllum distichum TaxID=126358 RepID=A0ABD1S1V1_9LAMI